jgi:purine-binding chemotaxis protein CheW
VEKVVCFAVSGQVVGAPIAAVRETVGPRPLTRAFLVPDVVAGLVNLRGDVVAVLDLAALLGLGLGRTRRRAGGSDGEVGPFVILRSREPGRSTRAACGLLVDALLGTREVAPSAIGPVPKTLGGDAAAHLAGVATVRDGDGDRDGEDATRPLLLLDPARIIDSERLRPLRPRREARSG